MTTTVESTPETTLGRVATSVCALLLFAALYALDRRGLFLWNGRWSQDPWPLTFGVYAAVTAALPWVPSAQRQRATLLASVLVGTVLLRWLIVVPLLLAWLAPRVARKSWPNWLKLLLLLSGWVLIALLCWHGPHGIRLRYTSFVFYWSFLPAPLICLVVERSRGQLDNASPLDEWLYLLAPPRFFTPFLQPIRATRFIASAGAPRTPRLALRGLLLGLYGMLGYFVIQYTHYAIKNPSDDFPLPQDPWFIVQNGFRIYAINATIIFGAVAQFRLLGFDLGSGFNFPLLARSMADFYRRWNYYFFEFASSIVYWPLMTRLRRWLPLWLAYVAAGFTSIFFGVWALDNVLAQLPLRPNGESTIQQLSDLRKLSGYVAVWTLIIVPQALLASPLRRARRFRWWRAASHVATIGLAVGVLILLFVLGVTVY